MVHWSVYPVIGTMLILFAWFSYRYLKGARVMDRLNEDHWEYLKSPDRMREGINYFTAETFDAHLRFPVEEEAS